GGRELEHARDVVFLRVGGGELLLLAAGAVFDDQLAIGGIVAGEPDGEQQRLLAQGEVELLAGLGLDAGGGVVGRDGARVAHDVTSGNATRHDPAASPPTIAAPSASSVPSLTCP